MRKIIVTAVIVTMAIFAMPSVANAGGCLIKMQTADQLKSEKPTLIDFEKRITSATGYWNTYGVKFTSENGVGAYVNSYNRGGVIGAPTASGLYALANHPYSGKTSANDPLKITFKDPVNAFGLYYGNTFKVDQVTFTFFNQDGVELCSDSVPYTWANTSAAVIESRAVTNFYGINTWFDFYAVTIDFGSSTNREMIDDVMFLKSNTNVRYCTETDSGFDVYTKSTTTLYNAGGTKFYDLADTCADKMTVQEAFCDGPSLNVRDLNCGTGYSCVEGACVVDKTIVTGGGGGGGACVKPRAITQQDLVNFGAKVINFENKTIDPIAGYWDTYGVKFTSANGKAIYTNSYNRGGIAKNVPTASGEYNLFNNANSGQTSYNQPLKITFKEPVNNFGFYFGNGENVKNVVIKFYNQAGTLICPNSDTIVNYQNYKYLNVFGKPITTWVGYSIPYDVYSVTLDYGPVYNGEAIDDLMFVKAQSPHIQKITLTNSSTSIELGANWNSYQDTKSYVQPETIVVPNTVSAVDISTLLQNQYNDHQFAFEMTHPLNASVLYNPTSTALWAGFTQFGNEANHTQQIFDSYRANGDAYVYLYAFVRNNDGISEVPNMPVEVDDVAVFHLKLEGLETQGKLDIVGNNITYLDRNILSGASGVEVNKFKLNASNSDVKIKQLGFMVLDENGEQVSNDLGAIIFASLYDENNVQIGSSLVNGTIGNIGFTNLNYVVTKDTAKYLTIKLDMSNFNSEYTGKKFRIKLTGGEVVDAVTGTVIDNNNLILTNTLSPVWTLLGSGSLVVDLRTDLYSPHDKTFVLAGYGKYVGQLQFRATNEDIKIKSLSLSGFGTGTENDFSSIELVNGDGVVVASANYNSDLKFSDLNYILPENAYTSLFIHVNTNGITNQSSSATSGHTLSFKMSGVEAEGVTTGNALNMMPAGSDPHDYVYLSANNFYDAEEYTTKLVITGTIIGNVNFVSSYGGYTVDNTLNGTGEYVTAILAVTTENNNNVDMNGNTLKTKLSGLRFNVDKLALTSLGKVIIQKIGGVDAAGDLNLLGLDNTINGLAYTNDLVSVLPNDYQIEPGSTNYYVVKTTINSLSDDPINIDWLRFSMVDLTGSAYPDTDPDNNIDWSDGLTNFEGLLSNVIEINGTKISE